MAGDSVVGALRVVLGIDTASLEDGLKKANNGLTAFGKNVASIATGISLERAINNLVHSFKNLITTGLETADSLGKMSQKIGIPVEQLSGLRLAANLSDVSLEQLGKGIKTLSVEALKAATGGVSPAVDAIRALGIQVKDSTGQLRPTQDVLLDLSDRFSKMDTGLEKTALSATIFGKKFGPELIPFLNLGKAAIQDLVQQAETLGLVISSKTAQSAERFNDTMKTIGFVVQGIALQATAQLSEGMNRLADSFLRFVQNSNLVKTAADGLVRGVAFLIDNLQVLNNVLGFFLVRLAITQIINFGAGLITLTRSVIALTTAFKLQNLVSLITVARFATLATVIALATGTLPSFTEALEKVGGTIAKMMPADVSDKISSGLKTLGIDVKALQGDLSALGTEFVGPLPEHAKRGSQGVVDALARINAERKKGVDTLGQIAAEQEAILARFRTPVEEMVLEVQKINDAFARGILSQEQFGIITERVALKVKELWASAAQSAITGWADAFKTLAGLNKRYASIAKVAAIGEAIVNTYLAATKALASAPPPFNYIAAAGVVAAGLANVAKIKATEFAKGGTFTVPGGISGVDTRMVPLKLAAGERVDITPANEARTARVVEVQIPGIRPGDFFRGDVLREMFDSLNRGITDGYRLKIA